MTERDLRLEEDLKYIITFSRKNEDIVSIIVNLKTDTSTYVGFLLYIIFFADIFSVFLGIFNSTIKFEFSLIDLLIFNIILIILISVVKIQSKSSIHEYHINKEEDKFEKIIKVFGKSITKTYKFKDISQVECKMRKHLEGYTYHIKIHLLKKIKKRKIKFYTVPLERIAIDLSTKLCDLLETNCIYTHEYYGDYWREPYFHSENNSR
jgi:hypothetical protein